jgi:hypothetical protein
MVGGTLWTALVCWSGGEDFLGQLSEQLLADCGPSGWLRLIRDTGFEQAK